MISLTMIFMWVSIFISLFFVIFWILVFLEKGMDDKKLRLKKYPFVSVAIPAYNEEKTIIDTIKSVLNLDYPHDKVEVMVINDGSKDSTGKIVEEFISNNPGRKITLINQENQGKGKSLNVALKKANGEFFTCLDADSFIGESAFKKMLPLFYEDKNVAIVLPLMKIKKPNNFLRKIQWCEYLINFFYKKIMSNIDCVHVAPGPFSVYRKSVLDKLGGFSNHNLTEDLEISLRIQKNNYKIVQVLNTEVYTVAPGNFKDFYKQRNRWYKGTLLNLFDYKKLIFNRKYGDFGMVQLPRVLLSGFFAAFAIIYFTRTYLLRPFLEFIHDIGFINFNLSFVMSGWVNRFTFLDINYMNLFLFFVLISVSLFIIRLAYKYTNEKVFRHGYISIPAYLVLYGMFAATIWFTVFIGLVFGKIQKW